MSLLPFDRRRIAPALTVVLVASLLISAAGGPASAADGDLDATFSGDGRVVSDFGSAERADGVAVQPDGRIVVAGTGCGGDFLVARYDAAGALDPTFSGDGRVCIEVGGSDERAVDVVALPDGRLLVAGTSGGNFAVIRLSAGGTVDLSFGVGGVATFDFGGADELRDVALAHDGGIVMVGETPIVGCAGLPGPTPGQSVAIAVARALPDGGPDPTFAGDGTVVLSAENQRQRGLAVAVQPDGRVLIGGRTASCTAVSIGFLLVRLTAGGAPEPTFDAGYPESLAGGPSSVADLAIQPDGKIVAAVDTFNGPATTPARDDAFTVLRFNPDGSLDTTFDGNGMATALFGEGVNATPTSLVLQGGKIVVGGTVEGDFALARFNTDGSPDTTFAAGGMVRNDFGEAASLNALAVQPDGKLVAAGHTGTDVVVARYGTSASPTTSTSTSTSSTSTSTSTSSTTVPSPFALICPVLAQIRSTFVSSPWLSPFVSIIDRLRVSFGCA